MKLPALDLQSYSLEQLIDAAQKIADKNPAETARIYSLVVDRVCEFEDKIRYQNLSYQFEQQIGEQNQNNHS